LIFGLDGVDAHQRGFMRFDVIRPNCRASSEIGAKKFRLYYGHPQFAGKRLVRTMQRTQFHAKSAENDLKPINFLRQNFYFETEGVLSIVRMLLVTIMVCDLHFLQM
jgi:hypothetical protein